MGFGVLGSCRRGGSRRQKRELQFLHNTQSDLVLNLEHVLEIAIIGLRPNVHTVAGSNQLGGNPDGIPGLAHAAFHDVGNVQGLGNLTDGGLLALEVERGGPGDDLEPGSLGEQIDQFLG
jgi:hypothetical protein